MLQKMMLFPTMNHTVCAYAGLSGATLEPLFSAKGNDDTRRFDPAHDLYPPPLTRSPSHVVYGRELWYAVIYFQYARVAELVRAHQHHNTDTYEALVRGEKLEALLALVYERNRAWYKYRCAGNAQAPQTQEEFCAAKRASARTYAQWHEKYPSECAEHAHRCGVLDVYDMRAGYRHVLLALTSENMCSNVPYQGNEYVWNRTLESLLRAYDTASLPRMLQLDERTHMTTPLLNALACKRYLAALVLLHYGAPYYPAWLERAQVFNAREPLRDQVPSFWRSEHVQRVQHSTRAPGTRLLALVEKGAPAEQCCITLEAPREPVVLEDGTVCEHDAAMRWLAEHDTSPRTGAPLQQAWIAYHLRRNEFVYCVEASQRAAHALFASHSMHIK